MRLNGLWNLRRRDLGKGIVQALAFADQPVEKTVDGLVARVHGRRLVAASAQVGQPFAQMLGRYVGQEGKSTFGEEAAKHEHRLSILFDRLGRSIVPFEDK